MFNGVSEFEQGEPWADLRAGNQYLDLAGFATFLGFEYRLPETLVLRFRYDESEARKLGWERKNIIELRFDGVRMLDVRSRPSPVVLESDRLSHYVYYEQDGQGLFEFVLWDGLRINFRCGALTFDRVE